MYSDTEHSGKLFIISGPSGAGKGTICQRLVEDTKVELSISMTTRSPRNGEADGVNYYFATPEQFQKKIAEGGFLEYAEVYGNYYGTPKQKVIDKLSAGIDVVLEIDIQGALNVKETYPNGIFIFILPPSMIMFWFLIGYSIDGQNIVISVFSAAHWQELGFASDTALHARLLDLAMYAGFIGVIAYFVIGRICVKVGGRALSAVCLALAGASYIYYGHDLHIFCRQGKVALVLFSIYANEVITELFQVVFPFAQWRYAYWNNI